MKLSGKTLIITGAASGIGRALAIEGARRGVSTICTDRDGEGLDETKALVSEIADAGTCSTHSLDVTDLAAWRDLRSSLQKEGDQIDGIINNAGITFVGNAEETSYEQINQVMAVNFMGQVYGSREFLADLKDRPEALIANVSSILGLVPKADQVAYCASKFAIRGYTEVLMQELKGTDVQVSAIFPGHIGTDILANAIRAGSISRLDLTSDEQDVIANQFREHGLSPQKAAQIIMDGVENGQSHILVGDDAIQADQSYRQDPDNYGAVVEPA
ncbi:MAG: SDR family NAD(P)-dependent oxidoreductase [Pseudomonadota bacterium]